MTPRATCRPSAPRGPRSVATVLLVALALATACAEPPPPPPERLVPHPVSDTPTPGAVLLERFVPADERGGWSLDADAVTRQPLDDAHPDGAQMLRLESHTPGTPVTLRRAGSYDLARIDRVRLELGCTGGTLVSAAFARRGAVLVATAPVSATHHAQVGPLDLVLQPAAADRGTADTLLLYFGDTPRAIRLASVALVETPAAALVPDPADGPRLALVGEQARRGVGVSTGRPVEVSFTAPPDGVLAFAAAAPTMGRWTGDDPELVLTLAPESGPSRDTRVRLARDADAPWRDVRVLLDGLEGRRVTARWSLDGPPGQDASCVVAEVAAWSRRLPPRPPILLVTTDTHRGDHLGAAHEGVEVDTPVLDALAARGVLFEDCFSTVNYTNPSHMALLTGRHPRDVGVLTNKQPVDGAAETLAERLRDAGYRTWAALSAHHLGDDVSGLGQGFDRMAWPDLPQRPAQVTLDVVAGWLDAEGLAGEDERPLFLWVHVFDAHRPYDPPDELVARYYDGPADPYDPSLPPLPGDVHLPGRLAGLRVLDHAFAQYKALVTQLDGQLARVLDHPRMTGAVVAVVGDHGEEFGDHATWFDHAELYRDTLHVPLVLAGPGVPAGLRDDRPVSHLDLGRTLLDLAGLRDVDFPGTSLVATGDASAASRDGVPRFALSSHGSSASITLGGLHLVLNLRGGHTLYEHHQVELYDLRADPACLDDLVDERADVAKALRARLVAWLREAPDEGLAAPAIDDPQVLADLAALGYTGGAAGGHAATWEDDGCDWCARFGDG